MKPGEDQKTKSVYFIVPSPLGITPGQRFRFEHYLELMEKHGIKFAVSPYFSLKGRQALYSNNITGKVFAVVAGYFRRIGDLTRLHGYQYIYIHREAAPIGPPVFEWIIAKILRKKIVYDFDDSIWVPAMSDYNKKFYFIKFFGKVSSICRWSHLVTVGNEYLRQYAAKQNPNVTILPTVVNTETAHKGLQNQDTAMPAVGWTGSFSTLKFLDLVLPVLQKLQDEIDFIFYVIADVDPALPLKSYKFIKWNKETESRDLLNFHIGLMPLFDDEQARGKCGFKAIQYMSMGIPALVSPVGVNTEIVTDRVDGYLCSSETDWEEKIRLLLKDRWLREKMGMAAHKKIIGNYSVRATEQKFLDAFR